MDNLRLQQSRIDAPSKPTSVPDSSVAAMQPVECVSKTQLSRRYSVEVPHSVELELIFWVQ